MQILASMSYGGTAHTAVLRAQVVLVSCIYELIEEVSDILGQGPSRGLTGDQVPEKKNVRAPNPGSSLLPYSKVLLVIGDKKIPLDIGTVRIRWM